MTQVIKINFLHNSFESLNEKIISQSKHANTFSNVDSLIKNNLFPFVKIKPYKTRTFKNK